MIERNQKSLLFREVWFDQDWSADGADVVLFYHWSKIVNSRAYLDVYSLEIDLGLSEPEIWRRFTHTTRNEINRATREGLQFSCWAEPDAGVIGQFLAFYQQFSIERGLGAAPLGWPKDYAGQHALLLTRAAAADGQTLVWHSYYRDPQWVRLLHSVSFLTETADRDVRNQVGRANRYLHWMDLVECRRLGIRHFDFGGWYDGGSDQKLLRINAFKEQFGGEKTHRYHSTLATSAKGRLFLALRKYLGGRDSLLHVV